MVKGIIQMKIIIKERGRLKLVQREMTAPCYPHNAFDVEQSLFIEGAVMIELNYGLGVKMPVACYKCVQFDYSEALPKPKYMYVPIESVQQGLWKMTRGENDDL